MLAEGCNLWVDSLDGCTWIALGTDGTRVAFERSIYQSRNLAIDIACGFGVCKGLISSGLLQALYVRDGTLTLSSSLFGIQVLSCVEKK